MPHVNQNFETNVAGIFIAGELGGMGLIKNSVEQGRQAVENIVKSLKKDHQADYDLVIVGAGPAGISASLTAKKTPAQILNVRTGYAGGNRIYFSKIQNSNDFGDGSSSLRESEVINDKQIRITGFLAGCFEKNSISIQENSKVESIITENGHFKIETLKGERYTSKTVLLSIGRRGTPRKLGIQGETLEKVAYRLLEPEEINGKDIMIVGGGDSAIESALLLADQNKVTLSYRNDIFGRLKPKNNEKIKEAMASGRLEVLFNTNPVIIEKEFIILATNQEGEQKKIKNDLIYIFAGGELPTEFLKKIGIQITKKFGEAVLKHK